MAKKSPETERRFEKTQKRILDLGHTDLPDSLQEYRYDPQFEIRASADQGAAVFLPTPVHFPEHDEEVEEIVHGLLARRLRNKPAVEKIVHKKPIEYEAIVNKVKPYLEGTQPITLRSLSKLTQQEISIICRMIKTSRGGIVVSIPVYKQEKATQQTGVLGSLIARTSEEALGAYLVLSTGYDEAMSTDSATVVIGKAGTLLQLSHTQLEAGIAMGVARPAFNMDSATRGTTGEFMDTFIQGLGQLDVKDARFFVDVVDVRNALKLALLLEASVSRDWQIAHETMSAKQQLLNLLSGTRNDAVTALGILFDPQTVDGRIFKVPEESPAEVAARFSNALAPIFEKISTWKDLVKALNDTKIMVTTRQDDQLVQVMANISPENMPSSARTHQPSVRLGDAFDANPVYIAARIKTLVDIRQEMIKREGILGNLQTLVTGAQTAFEGKQAQALLSFIQAAEAAIDLDLAADAGDKLGRGVNARLMNHTIAGNADLPTAPQLEQRWGVEQQRGQFIGTLAQQAIKLLSEGPKTDQKPPASE